MEYGKFTLGTVLWAGVALPIPVSSSETTGASASARITLHAAPRVEWRQSDTPSTGQLCLAHIPAYNYYLSIRNTGEGSETEIILPGRTDNYCVPLPTPKQGEIILIVAE